MNPKLKRMVKLMYHHHPYFSRKLKDLDLKPSDFKDKKDLSNLPVINKLEWIKEVKDFILQPREDEMKKTLSVHQKVQGLIDRERLRKKLEYEFKPVTFFATSGRTSSPAPAFLTGYDMDLLKKYSSRTVSKIIEDLDKKIAQNLFPHAPHLAYWQTHLSCRGIPDVFSFSLGAGRTEFQIKLMDEFKTTILAGMPTYVKYFSDLAKEKGVESNVKFIFMGGEGVPEKMKGKIKDNFSEIGPEPEIISTYGLTETKIALVECHEGSGYHIFPGLHEWEVVDPESLEPVGEEEGGLLVFSHTDFRGTVFLRYAPGDIAVKGITHEKCPFCGSEAPRIIGGVERLSDRKTLICGAKVKGELINFNTLDEILSEFESVKQYQVIIKKSDESDPYSLDKLVILLGFEKNVDDKGSVIEKISRKVKAFTNLTPDIRCESPEHIFQRVMGFKGQRVVDERSKNNE